VGVAGVSKVILSFLAIVVGAVLGVVCAELAWQGFWRVIFFLFPKTK